tara:strand:+ start:3834 stop:4667 length:834 start_codon:yes stop_codon:yes gene_type:complete
MRDAVKSDYYWERAMEEAVKHGFEEFAMTLNPFPGATAKAVEYAIMAKSKGFKVINVTTTLNSVFDAVNDRPTVGAQELLDIVDIISISVDEHRFKTPQQFVQQLSSFDDYLGDELNFYDRGKLLNINLLWTPTVFTWSKQLDEIVSNIFDWRNEIYVEPDDEDTLGITIQHLIFKPLSLYPSVDWFYDNYTRVMEESKYIKIQGDGLEQIGDAAFNNSLGMTECPGMNMIDIDPMGFARKCPENPDSHDATTIYDLKKLLISGVPGCMNTKCNCIV